MANNLPEPRTVFHKRLQGVNDRMDAGFKALNSSLGDLTMAVKARPPVEIKVILNVMILEVKIGDVVDLASCNCIHVASDQSMQDAVICMQQQRITMVFVHDKQRIVGMITRTQCLEAMTAGKMADSVSTFMVKRNKFITVKIDDTIETALDTFVTEKVKRLVVVNPKGEPKGLLTLAALQRWITKRMNELRSSGQP